MSKVAGLAKNLAQMVTTNSPAILTGLGVAGVVTTTALAIRGTVKAYERVRLVNLDRERVDEADLNSKEVLKLVWPEYIPTVAMGAVTISAIVTSHHISMRRQAAIVSLYSLTHEAFSDYRSKVVEKLGETKELAIRDEVAKDRIDKDPVTDKTIFIANGGDLICYDEHTGRYFESDMETLRSSENTFNSQIINHGYASLNDWYRLIGIKPIPTGEELGWNSDKLMEIRYSAHLTPNNKPCLSIGFYAEPLDKYYKAFI